MRGRSILLAVAAGLVLADASVVTLALPQLLVQLDTTVEGVAAILGVYTVVLAALLPGAERLARVHGPARVGAAGFGVFAAACVACGAAGSLAVLLVARGVQAAGGAAALVATFALLHGERSSARRLWLGAAVLSAALGPALGGALTEAFSWRAIFYVQVPLGAAAATWCWALRAAVAAPRAAAAGEAPAAAPLARWRAGAGLGLVSAALTAVLFLLVLLLVAGWAISPLAAAAAVTVLPAAALAGSRLPGDARWRAAGGCLLVALGTGALAYMPRPSVAWTLAPQVLAGLGMGLSLPALAGELLPERDARDAARLLTLRHVGIAVALAILAPVTASRLDTATHDARIQGAALILDARLSPGLKLELAPGLLEDVHQASPRASLRRSAAEHRADVDAGERAEYARLTGRADDVLVRAVSDSFYPAFLITAGFALLAALVLLTPAALPVWLPVAVALGVAVVAVDVAETHRLEPAPVAIRDPCKPRALPETGGIGGFLQDRALGLLDTLACRYGSSREELVLAYADPDEAERFQRAHGVDPRSAGGLLGGLLSP